MNISSGERGPGVGEGSGVGVCGGVSVGTGVSVGIAVAVAVGTGVSVGSGVGSSITLQADSVKNRMMIVIGLAKLIICGLPLVATSSNDRR